MQPYKCDAVHNKNETRDNHISDSNCNGMFKQHILRIKRCSKRETDKPQKPNQSNYRGQWESRKESFKSLDFLNDVSLENKRVRIVHNKPCSAKAHQVEDSCRSNVVMIDTECE